VAGPNSIGQLDASPTSQMEGFLAFSEPLDEINEVKSMLQATSDVFKSADEALSSLDKLEVQWKDFDIQVVEQSMQATYEAEMAPKQPRMMSSGFVQKATTREFSNRKVWGQLHSCQIVPRS